VTVTVPVVSHTGHSILVGCCVNFIASPCSEVSSQLV